MASAEYYRNRRAKARIKAIDYLGGCCKHCGTEDNLEFDHIIPKCRNGNKKANITCLLYHKWDTLKLELDLCQLLCKKCHKEKTQKDLPEGCKFKKGAKQHGAITGFTRHGCSCELCLKGHRLKNELRRKKRADENRGIGIICKRDRLPRGVTVSKGGRYIARTTVNYKTVSLGSYDTAQEAGNAYVEYNRKNRPKLDIGVKYFSKSK